MTALERAFDRWRRANTDAASARAALRRAIRAEVDRGASQSDVARALGWPRQRVSKLLG
jgi:plasmid maintenance system antidote protein VapI